MKKIFFSALILATVLILYAVPKMQKTRALYGGKEIKVFLLYHPDYLKQAPAILAAYGSVLQEEGVPYENADVYQIAISSVDDVVKRVPIMVLPDGILQNVPTQFSQWAREYLNRGGNLLIIYDVGVRHQNGTFLNTSAFADIIGLNTITYATEGIQAYDFGHIGFSSEASRDFFQIPPGKTVDGLTLSSYSYGKLIYPLVGNEPIRNIHDRNIYAYGITKKNKKFPAIVLTDYGKGKVLYVNLPLGQLKANADDLPLRAVLRTFLFTVVGIPHLVNVENGLGSIIINWHIDCNDEYKTLPEMKRTGLLRSGIPASFHITAGDFCYYPGDGAGFDACGKGRPLVELMKAYGTIGSHGGWGHNWFAKNIEDGIFKEKEIRQYIVKNDECLEKITGYKIIEYSAPVGVHPQPTTTYILDDLGFIAYYSTGDTGSTPNRTFYNGSMITSNVIAFPIMPFGRAASLYEMFKLDKRKESEVTDWFLQILSYIARNRTTRLVYSHPYNIPLYPHAVKVFIDKAETMMRSKQISIRTMSDYATFFLRFLKTSYAFSREGKKIVVTLKNPEGLAGICIALPKQNYRKPLFDHTTLQEDDRYYYLTVVPNEKEKKFMVDTY
jgi:hypothetical protein